MKMMETDNETGDLFLKFKVVDPAWRQRILREWRDYKFKLVIEDEDEKKD